MVRKLILASLLLLPSLAFAQDVSVRYQSQVIGSRGLPLANQSVAVCTQPAVTTTQPCSPLATLATSTSTTSGGANPLTTDVNGNFFFYAPPGKYTVQVYGPQVGTPFVQPDTAIGLNGAGGAIFVQRINNIRIAANFVGTDWCAKVTAAYNDLIASSATSGEIWIDQSAGTSACVAAPPGNFVIPLHFHWTQPGVYHLNASWTIANTGWTVGTSGYTGPQMEFSGPIGTILQFDNTATNAFLIDGSLFPNSTVVFWHYIEVSGNANIANAIVLKGISRSTLYDMRASNVTNNAIWCQGCLADTVFVHPQVTDGNRTWVQQPTNGMVIDWISAAANASNDTWIIDPEVVHVSGTGILALGSNETHIIGGVIDRSGVGGIRMSAQDASITGIRHTIEDVHMEQNSTFDVYLNGSYGNEIRNVTGVGAYTNLKLDCNGFACSNDNMVRGGWYNSVSIANSSIRNNFVSVAYNYSGTGTFTDSNTTPTTTLIELKNWATGARTNSTPISLRSSLVLSDQGSICTNGELALSTGWQSTGAATVTGVAGNGQTCSWTVTTGTTTAANPTVTDTLTNALPAATTVCEMNIHGGTHTPAAGESFQQTTLSGTAPVFTFNGTPTAGGTTYFVTRRCGP